MYIDATLGTMLQGVSQQRPEVRTEGKVTDQVNFISDVEEGLISRSGAVLHGVVRAQPRTQKYSNFELGGQDYVIWYTPDDIRMFTKTGTPVSLSYDSAALTYLGNDMRTYVFENTVYLVNRNKIVRKSSENGLADVWLNAAYVSVLGGLFSRKYRIRLRYADGTEAVGVYQTPDGTTEGDAEKARATYIAAQLLTNIKTHAQYKSTIDARSDATLYFYNPAGTSISVSDDDANTTIRAVLGTSPTTADLPKTAAHGSFVRITGKTEENQDDYYLRFNASGTNTLGAGFGQGGVWEEWVNPNEVLAFDLSTMPHVLVRKPDGSFEFKPGAWLPRRVGDNKSNPFVDIVGYPIRDIGGFQSRLVFVGGPWCVMSRTNKPTDLFKSTALAELDTDPISMTSTQEGAGTLDWLIPFDRDLVMMSDPGKGQFIINGGTTLTPKNASIVVSTAFHVSGGGAKPVETGRTILFPFRSGRWSGIKEFFTNDEVATNGADTITETLSNYIQGAVSHMDVNTNFSIAALNSFGAGAREIFIYKYLWENTQQLQSAWSKWRFPHKVEHFFWSGGDLIVILSHLPVQGDGNLYLFASVSLDPIAQDATGYAIALDLVSPQTVRSNGRITCLNTSPGFVQGPGCAQPGSPISPFETTAATEGVEYSVYGFRPEDAPPGAIIYAGAKMPRWVTPTMPFIRTQDGQVRPRTQLVVDTFSVQYMNTGYIKAVMRSPYRADTWEMVMNWFPTEGDPRDPTTKGLRSGSLDVPWGERSDWSELQIWSDDPRPTNITNIEFSGQGFVGARG